MNTYDVDRHFLNLLAHCHFQSHLFCLYSQIVRSALLVIIFWTNWCDQFFSLLQHLYKFPAYKVLYICSMLVGHGIGYGILHTYTIIQEYPCGKKEWYSSLCVTAWQYYSWCHDTPWVPRDWKVWEWDCWECRPTDWQRRSNQGAYILTRCTIAIIEYIWW